MKNQNQEKNLEEIILKNNYLKLTGTSGTEYYLVKIIGRGTFGVVYEAYGSKANQNNSLNGIQTINYPFEENKEDSNQYRRRYQMDKYVCPCGYVYDPEIGDPYNGIAPGTAFEDLPEDWVCPVCGVGKEDFEPAE